MEIVYLVLVLLFRDGSINTTMIEQPSVEACRIERDAAKAEAKGDWQAQDFVAVCQRVRLVKGVET